MDAWWDEKQSCLETLKTNGDCVCTIELVQCLVNYGMAILWEYTYMIQIFHYCVYVYSCQCKWNKQKPHRNL